MDKPESQTDPPDLAPASAPGRAFDVHSVQTIDPSSAVPELELPDYFLIDLPEEAPITPRLITDACRTLKRNRERFLKCRATESIILAISNLGERWLEPNYHFRQFCLEKGPEKTGFSRQTLEKGLDQLFQTLTGENLQHWVQQDLGHWKRLDSPVSPRSEMSRQRMAIATGPDLIAHITAGRLPNPAILHMILGLLAKSAQFIKCATGTSFIPRLFAHSLYEIEPKLGACMELIEWPGGTREFEDPLFKEASCVTAMGDDSTMQELRQRLPYRTRFLAYGSRASFAFIAKDGVTQFNTKSLARSLADDVAAWDQCGCLSPHVVYIEKGGNVSADHFAEHLAQQLDAVEQEHPRGALSDQESAAIATRRSIYELRAAHSTDTFLWKSEDSTAWTVVYEDNPSFQLSCANRFIFVKSVENLEQALAGAEMFREKVSTVGLAANEDHLPELVTQLAHWGALRVCPIGKMQEPDLWWRHDGRPSLGDLVTWTDWEL